MNKIIPSENWDDDFELGRGQNNDTPCVSASSSNFTEDWDNDSPHHGTAANQLSLPLIPLQVWAEPGGLSTPTKRPQSQAENWDDDFEDKADSPAARPPPSSYRNKPHVITPSSSRQQRRLSHPDHESWDDDFESGENKGTAMVDCYSLSKRTRQDAYLESSDEEEEDEGAELGFADKDEDRTVTARSRRRPHPKLSPPPPVPTLPQSLLGSVIEPFPRSPSASVFSVPTSTAGHNSVRTYMSTSHIPLRPTLSGGSLAMLPPSPPIHRERRRLRKKSRPPHLYDNVFELVESNNNNNSNYETQSQLSPPRTPDRDRPISPTPLHSPNGTGSVAASPGSTKGQILSRIGSVKKWGVRKKRASVGAQDTSLTETHNDANTTPRPPSATSQTQQPPLPSKTSWFFRTTGGDSGSGSPPELKKEKSIDRMRFVTSAALVEMIPDSPTRPSKRKSSRIFEPADNQETEKEREPKPSLLSAMRKPSSLHPNRNQRHVSDGSASIGRSASNTLVGPSVEDLGKDIQEGGRRFLGGVRRISLVGPKKHRRNKSGTVEVVPLPPSALDIHVRPSIDELLPPIELQQSAVPPAIPSLSVPTVAFSPDTPVASPKRIPPSAIGRSSAKAPGSPQSASLGRSTAVPGISAAASASTNPTVPRRNSLGDLKIPPRISQAQVSLRRDLGLVRDFAASVEQLKELQATYYKLVAEVQALLDTLQPARTTSPTFFHLPRAGSRARSNTNPVPPHRSHKQLATALHTIDSKYRISWECAELLIELGGGTPAPAPASPSPPSSNTSAAGSNPQEILADSRKNRERAITLAGDEQKPSAATFIPLTADPPNLAWRASTGRNDLSQRQLIILREMLNNPDGTLQIPEDAVVNRAWHWGDAMSSTITLPSEESPSAQLSSPAKKRRSNKMGMSGLREMLKALKKTHTDHPPPLPTSSASASTESSIDGQHYYHHPQLQTPRRRPKTSTGPESIKSTRNQHQDLTSPYNVSSLMHRSSPRRPSLASIFRIGQKSKTSVVGPDSSLDSITQAQTASGSSNRNSTMEEDWDRMDSASDLEHAAKALSLADSSATVRCKKGSSPYLQQQRSGTDTSEVVHAASRSSILSTDDRSPIQRTRSTRLSNVEENVDDYRGSKSIKNGKKRASLPVPSPSTLRSRKGLKTDSVRSAPPQGGNEPLRSISDFKLAMTPENIKPLLENAREVHARLNECLAELRALLV